MTECRDLLAVDVCGQRMRKSLAGALPKEVSLSAASVQRMRILHTLPLVFLQSDSGTASVLNGCTIIRPGLFLRASLPIVYTLRVSDGAGDGLRPFEPRKVEYMEKASSARTSSVVVRVHPEERDLLKVNAGMLGMSVSDFIRQACLNFRLRQTPEEKRRNRELARIGSNLNQLARWANTHKKTLEAVEILTELASLEESIREFATSVTKNTKDESHDDESFSPRYKPGR